METKDISGHCGQSVLTVMFSDSLRKLAHAIDRDFFQKKKWKNSFEKY